MKVQFKTGRTYSEHGQRIVAVVTHGGIFFKDHDRMIDGFIVCVQQNLGIRDVQEIVMFAYDHGMYAYNCNSPAINLDWEES